MISGVYFKVVNLVPTSVPVIALGQYVLVQVCISTPFQIYCNIYLIYYVRYLCTIAKLEVKKYNGVHSNFDIPTNK